MFPSEGKFGSFGHFGSQGPRNASWSNRPGGFSQAAYNGSFNQIGFINELTFLTVKSSRQSTIILATFNIISAAATAAGILYNNYLSAKRSPSRRKERVNVFTCVRGPDVYPFILSLGIVVQGIIFAVSQAQGLDRLVLPGGCALISQFMWPAIFIVPYIQLVFTVETTVRALKSNPFPPRGKWTVAICLTIIKIALLATGLVAFFIRAPNFCFASLFWFVEQWAEGGFTLLIGIIFILIGCGITIHLKLRRCSMIDEEERIAGSRMIYYIVLAIVPNALMTPFFSYVSFGNPFLDRSHLGPTLSMVATVVANVTGLMTGGLYLFLRSSTISPISPKNKLEEYEHQQPKYQIGNPYDTHYSQRRNAFKRNSIVQNQKLAQTPSFKSSWRKPISSYGLFPSRLQINRASKPVLPSTVFPWNGANRLSDDCCDVLQPPPPVQPPGFRHKRDSSMASHATVQIGLRISNVEDARPITSSTAGGVERIHSLGCPKNSKFTSANRPSPLIASGSTTRSSSPPRSLEIDTAMKTLPPVPQGPQADADRALILNPTVYNPNSPTKGKVPSPKGVGFNVPPRSNTNPTDSIEAVSPVARARGNSASVASSADWI